MDRLVNSATALAELEKVVTGNESFRYHGDKNREDWGTCKYLDHDGEPLCLVGHVAVNLGVDKNHLRRMDDLVKSASALSGDGHIPSPEGFEFTFGAVEALRKAQMVQDQNGTWGEALAAAKKEVG